MVDYTLSFGAIQDVGEVAIDPLDTSEITTEMALALGVPAAGERTHEVGSFQILPVYCDQLGPVGHMHKIQYNTGRVSYRFISLSGQTDLWADNVEILTEEVKIRLALVPPPD